MLQGCRQEAVPTAPARAAKRHSKRVRAHAAAYYRYHFTDPKTTYWGVGTVEYGAIFWEREGSFNGHYHNIWQAGNVTQGAHKVKYHFYIDAWRKIPEGWEWREGRTFISGTCTTDRVRQPTWGHYHTEGHDYRMELHFQLRDCAVDNPSTSDGLFYSPYYLTKNYHCVDSTETCYFIGY